MRPLKVPLCSCGNPIYDGDELCIDCADEKAYHERPFDVNEDWRLHVTRDGTVHPYVALYEDDDIECWTSGGYAPELDGD